jgi:hypothetical protein
VFEHALDAVNSHYFHATFTQLNKAFNPLYYKAAGALALRAVLQRANG